jgi:hypothetical protein
VLPGSPVTAGEITLRAGDHDVVRAGGHVRERDPHGPGVPGDGLARRRPGGGPGRGAAPAGDVRRPATAPQRARACRAFRISIIMPPHGW